MLSDNLEDGVEREMGGRFKRERTYVYLWLIYADVWQKPSQYCVANFLPIKYTTFFKDMEKIVQIWEKSLLRLFLLSLHSGFF